MASRRTLDEFLSDIDRTVDRSFLVRQAARQQKDSHESSIDWNFAASNQALSKRLDQLTDAERKLLEAGNRVDDVTYAVTEAKSDAEIFVRELKPPMAISQELRNLRETNRMLKRSDDPIWQELLEEINLLRTGEKEIHGFITDCRQTLVSLKDIRDQVDKHLDKKRRAYHVDTVQYGRTLDSPDLSYQLAPTRMPMGFVEEPQWYNELERFLELITFRLQEAGELSVRLRTLVSSYSERINAKRHQLTDLLQALMRQLQKSMEELETRSKQIDDEITRSQADITDLQSTYRRQCEQAIKLAETRLESRHLRPVTGERCEDSAQTALKSELYQLYENRRKIDEKLMDLKKTTAELNQKKVELIQELQDARQLMEMERRCLNVRQRLENEAISEDFRRMQLRNDLSPALTGGIWGAGSMKADYRSAPMTPIRSKRDMETLTE